MGFDISTNIRDYYKEIEQIIIYYFVVCISRIIRDNLYSPSIILVCMLVKRFEQEFIKNLYITSIKSIRSIILANKTGIIA
jgi:hypothetical protein